MIPPKKKVLFCPKCFYFRLYAPKSDVLRPSDIITDKCPKCGGKLIIVKFPI